jgi:hypothetical protein
VSPLFRKSEEKAAREAAGQAEFERVIALPVADLAGDLMPAFGPDGLHALHERDSDSPGSGINLFQLARWLGTTYCPSGGTYARELMEPVRQGLQRLENAALVLGTEGHQATWGVTRLGQTALADGTVQDHLAGQPST